MSSYDSCDDSVRKALKKPILKTNLDPLDSLAFNRDGIKT